MTFPRSGTGGRRDHDLWVNIGDKPSIGLSALTVFSPCFAADRLDDLWHVFISQSLSFLVPYNVGDVSYPLPLPLGVQ